MKKLIICVAMAGIALGSFAQKGGLTGAGRICDSRYAAFGLQGKTISDAVKFVGNTHDEYQEHILNSMISNNVRPSDANFNDFIRTQTISFFQGKGVDASRLPAVTPFDLNNPSFQYGHLNTSSAAREVLDRTKAVLDHVSVTPKLQLIQSLETIKNDALNLTDEKEAIAVGSTIDVAIHSFQYWENNFGRWQSYLSAGATINPGAKNKPCLGSIGFADVSGAIQGAIGGSALGPGGALAFGVLGSATSSLGAAFGCALGNLFSWW
jgi:hypothetical protein